MVPLFFTILLLFIICILYSSELYFKYRDCGGYNMKYEIIKEDTLNYGNITLYRMRALEDFDDVKKGDLGGYIEATATNVGTWVEEGDMLLDCSQKSAFARIYDNVIYREEEEEDK